MIIKRNKISGNTNALFSSAISIIIFSNILTFKATVLVHVMNSKVFISEARLQVSRLIRGQSTGE
jgi:hypothetical protein